MVKEFKILVAALLFVAAASVAVKAEEPDLYRIPERSHSDPTLNHFSDRNTGFWWSAELSLGGSWRNPHPKNANAGFGEIDFTAGYRFNEYVRVGAGAGLRYYFPAHHLRASGTPLSGPLYVNVRGSLMPCLYKDIVPYYSFDLGGAFNDGFMWRPTIGLRFGTLRNAFLLGLTYTGQTMRTINRPNKHSYVSLLSLKFGYEF